MIESRRIVYGSAEYRAALQLRDEVLRKPLGLSVYGDPLELEREYLLCGLFDDGRLVAYAHACRGEDGAARIKQVAVADDMRGRRLGRTVMAFAENACREAGFETVTVHARRNVEGFYRRLGYVQRGEPFVEVGVPHVAMDKAL